MQKRLCLNQVNSDNLRKISTRNDLYSKRNLITIWIGSSTSCISTIGRTLIFLSYRKENSPIFLVDHSTCIFHVSQWPFHVFTCLWWLKKLLRCIIVLRSSLFLLRIISWISSISTTSSITITSSAGIMGSSASSAKCSFLLFTLEKFTITMNKIFIAWFISVWDIMTKLSAVVANGILFPFINIERRILTYNNMAAHSPLSIRSKYLTSNWDKGFL